LEIEGGSEGIRSAQEGEGDDEGEESAEPWPVDGHGELTASTPPVMAKDVRSSLPIVHWIPR